MRSMVVVAAALGACAAEPEPADTDRVVVLPDSLDGCGLTCGDGPIYLVSALTFVEPVDGVIEGFDLDGDAAAGGEGDCGVADLRAPDGTPGVDNQFGAVLSSLPSTVGAILPDSIALAIREGRLSLLTEVIGPPDLSVDGPAALAFRYGTGEPLVQSDDTLVWSQTIGLSGEPPAGYARDVVVQDGTALAAPFDLDLRLDFLGTPVAFRLQQARVRLALQADGSVAGAIGGVISLADVLGIVGLLGGDDTALRNTLQAVVPLLVDSRTTPGADCDGLSVALGVTGIPAFVAAAAEDTSAP